MSIMTFPVPKTFAFPLFCLYSLFHAPHRLHGQIIISHGRIRYDP
jgi:hypothetical protein